LAVDNDYIYAGASGLVIFGYKKYKIRGESNV